MSESNELEQCERESNEGWRKAHEENAHWVLGAMDWEMERKMIEGTLTREEVMRRLQR